MLQITNDFLSDGRPKDSSIALKKNRGNRLGRYDANPTQLENLAQNNRKDNNYNCAYQHVYECLMQNTSFILTT